MHSNVMEKLINSIKLISFNYMYSSNKTLDRFGIEYSYIALAMGNMLKSTNNSVKNIEIDKTVGIAIDWNWGCIISTLVAIATFIALLVLLTTPEGAIVLIGTTLFYASLGLNLGLDLYAGISMVTACFPNYR